MKAYKKVRFVLLRRNSCISAWNRGNFLERILAHVHRFSCFDNSVAGGGNFALSQFRKVG
jgi:hypothetical protein